MSAADDPRTHITPYAFGVAPELLGYALATPTRRLFAIGIDLALAALIARTGIEFLIAAAAALVAWRAIGGPAERLLAGRGRVVFRAASAILALFVVVNIWNAAAERIGRLKDREPAGEEAPRPPDAEAAGLGDTGEDVELALEDLGLSAGQQATFMIRFARLQMADTAAAGERGAELGRWVRQQVSPGARRDAFAAALAEAMNPAARKAFLPELGSGAAADSTGDGDSAAASSQTVAPSPPQVAATEQDAQDEPSTGGAPDSVTAAGTDTVRAAAIPPADSVQLLAAANRQLRERNERLRRQAEAAQERGRGGISGLLGGISNDLGLGFGWFALYFTAFTVLGRGQTPGKRLLGIKVIRLDNRPIGWWPAFERFGGYAASFSIGLLGFAQVLWDRNRQALHDKAIGTVVVRLRKGQPFRIA